MKPPTFRVETRVGPFDRFGVVRLAGGPGDTVERARRSDGRIVDADFAYAAMAAARGRADPDARADAFCPADSRTTSRSRHLSRGPRRR